jgi:signal transduction histidine kinase
MFSEILDSVRKKINLRLSAVFSLLFIASSLILFGATYLMLNSFVTKEDADALRMRMFELWVHYQSGGLAGLIEEVMRNQENEEGTFIVRIADSDNKTLFLHARGAFNQSDVNRFENELADDRGKIVIIRLRNPRRSLEASAIRLSDGNVLQVGMDVTNRERLLKRIQSTFAIAIIPLVLLSFITGSLISARTLRPISKLSAAVRSIVDTGKIEARISPKSARDELGDLVILFNKMLERIQTLVEGMKGTLDAVAHDLRTPMTRLRGSAEMALNSGEGADSCREALVDCIEESDHILTMLNTIMDISEAETGTIALTRTDVDLSTLIQECVELYEYVAEEKGVYLSASVSGGLHLSADRGRLRRVVLNLLDNAVKYTHQGGKVEVQAVSENGVVRISVIDSGVGIEQDELPHIWDRLYRGRDQGGRPGLGLGLSFVRAIVTAHGGEASVKSAPGRGSEFTIRLRARGSGRISQPEL